MHSSKEYFLTRIKNELAGILHVIACNSVFYSGSRQDYCCFKERWSPNGLWSDWSYINRLFALSADAIITNYFQALWELNNFVMHHWTFSCFDSRWFQGSICSQQCFQQAPFTFTKRFRNIRIFIPHHRCLSWSLPIHRHSCTLGKTEVVSEICDNLLCVDYFCQQMKTASILGKKRSIRLPGTQLSFVRGRFLICLHLNIRSWVNLSSIHNCNCAHSYSCSYLCVHSQNYEYY